MIVRVVSYNLLSKSLARASYYPRCSKSDLNASTRLARAKEKLESYTKFISEACPPAVIALQEVSLSWAGDLTIWFKQRGYTFICSNYGTGFSDFMGVALAIPDDLYLIDKVSIVRPCARAKRWTFANAVEPAPLSWLSWIYRLIPGTKDITNAPARHHERKNALEAVSRRHNRMILATLKTKGEDPQNFCVATYHMPCVYWDERAMVCHAALSMDAAERYADSMPYIYMGDFNICPPTPGYRMLTRGGAFASCEDEEGNPFVPGVVLNMEDNDNDDFIEFARNISPLQSAYASFGHGDEPDMTNHTYSGDPPQYFTGCIDYVFTSTTHEKDAGQWSVRNVVPLPKNSDNPKICPNASESSDHFLIGATLQLS